MYFDRKWWGIQNLDWTGHYLNTGGYVPVDKMLDTPGENHLTESELESRTMVKWVTFDELVRLINEQEFDRIQGKYLKARDVAALKEYSKLIME